MRSPSERIHTVTIDMSTSINYVTKIRVELKFH